MSIAKTIWETEKAKLPTHPQHVFGAMKVFQHLNKYRNFSQERKNRVKEYLFRTDGAMIPVAI